jgi:Fe-S-cluster-containing hydrogenase component 2
MHMMVVQINQEECIGCGACMDVCRPGAISLVDNKATIDPHRCRQCQVCVSACPAGAIAVVEQPSAQAVGASPAPTLEHSSTEAGVVPAKAERVTQQLLPATSGQTASISKQTVSYEALPTTSSKEQQNSLLQRLSLSFVMAIERLACPARSSFAAEMGERRRRRWGRGYGSGRGYGNGNGHGRAWRNGRGRHERRRGEL